MVKMLKIKRIILTGALCLSLSGHAVKMSNSLSINVDDKKRETMPPSWESALPMFQIMNLSF